MQVRTFCQLLLREPSRQAQHPNPCAHVLANVDPHRGNGAGLDKIGLHTIVCMTIMPRREPDRDRHDALTGIFAGALLFVWVLACSGGGGMVDVTAEVSFSGAQFTVRNPTAQSWTDLRFKLNDEFQLKVARLPAGESLTVGAMQFAKSDGTRFNAFQMKPLNISMTATLPDGKTAWYYGRWK